MTATIRLVLFLLAVLVLVAVVAQRLKTRRRSCCGRGIALRSFPVCRGRTAPELVLLVAVATADLFGRRIDELARIPVQPPPDHALAFGCVGSPPARRHRVHYLLGWPMGCCLVLGAIVAPPDVVARLAMPRRLALRGGCCGAGRRRLANDATALILYASPYCRSQPARSR